MPLSTTSRRYRLPKLAAWLATALMRSLHYVQATYSTGRLNQAALQRMVEGLDGTVKNALIARLCEVNQVRPLQGLVLQLCWRTCPGAGSLTGCLALLRAPRCPSWSLPPSWRPTC